MKTEDLRDENYPRRNCCHRWVRSSLHDSAPSRDWAFPIAVKVRHLVQFQLIGNIQNVVTTINMFK